MSTEIGRCNLTTICNPSLNPYNSAAAFIVMPIFLAQAFNPVAKVIPNYSSATGPAGITKGSTINFKFKVIWPRGQPVNPVDILLFMIGRVIPPLIANHSVILSLIFFSDIFHTLSHMLIIL